MSNYTPIVNFAPKDALTTGDPAKKIKGVEVAAEFTSISSMSATKEDTANKGIANGYAPLNASILLADSFLTSNIPRLNTTNVFTGEPFVISSTAPKIRLFESDAAVDNKYVEFIQSAETFGIRFLNDALSAGPNFITVNRTGTTVDDLTLSATLLTLSGVVTTTAGIELGHASDTTLTRSAAGVMDVEGHTIVTDDQAQTISAVYNFTSQPTINSLSVGYLEVPQNSQAGNYTLVLADNGKHIYHASGAGAGDTYTIPANASVAYPIGTVLTFVNNDSNAVSIAITTDTMTLAGTTTTGTRTLGQNGMATAIKTTSTTWLINGSGLT